MRSFTAGAIAIAIVAFLPGAAGAQYGYPGGYGGYGWGGWGSTIQGSTAAGLGYFNMGRGAYNEQTAVARSINNDTYLRWNQYMYLSQQHANTMYQKRLRAEHMRVDRANAAIEDRLRTHPEERDITDGDALEVLVDALLNPSAGVSLSTIKTPLKSDLIQDIPFRVASEGVTICIDQMTMNEQWPLALRVDAFKPERERLRKAVIEALEEDKKGDLEPKTVENVQAAIDRLRTKFHELVPPTSPDYIPAHDTIKGMAGLAKMLYSPKIEEILAELEDYGGTTLGELLAFMQAYNLRFAKANSFRQRRIYMKLYPMLLEQVSGRVGPGAPSGGNEVAANEPAASTGPKAVEGLKSAAVDFFKDMDWKHLSGTSKATAGASARGFLMSYAPLVQPAEIASQANPFARSPAINSLFNRCYGSDILPSRAQFPRSFAHQDVFANLYLSERRWGDEVDFPPEDALDRHEQYLDELFWSKDVANGLICVLGAVGSGKSTLVDYYLRCYCGTKGRNRAEFDKKLIVHFDSKVIQDNTDFYHDFFLFAQSSIRYQCSQKGFEIDVAIKRRPTQPNNVREWVWAALEELTRIAEKRDPAAPFHHIVLVVDNLDQTPPAVQIRAITEVEQWLLTPTIKLWRVFLPLWPSTYNSLRNHRFNLLRGASVFRIGAINNEFLLENYDRAAIDRLSASSSSLERQAAQYLSEITALAKDRILPRIERLAHGSLRLTLALWDGFLRSEGAYSIWRHAQAAPGSRRGYDYELLDALIVGAFSSLNHGFHRVANLFAMGHAHAKPRDILIGPHALKLMHQGVRSHRALADSLDTLGYSEQNVDHVVAGLGTFNVLHQIPSRGGLIEYELHDAVIAEYLELLSEPAYLDDVAIVTPVDRSARDSMYRTRGDRPDDFPARVESSISFLKFLRESEDRFRDPSQLRPGVDQDAFREALTRNPLPCLWRRMAVEYKQRLIGLRNSGYLKTVDAAWWNKPLADPVLAAADDAPDVLAPL